MYGWLCGFGGLKSSDALPFRVFADAILFFVFVSTDLKVRGYWPSASRLSDAFSLYCHAELVSASHSEPFLVFLRGQILKRVQDDVGWCEPLAC